MTTTTGLNLGRTNTGTRTRDLDFSSLDDQRFQVTSKRDFDSVVDLMNARFSGLPSFHRSVGLELREERKLVSEEHEQLSIPEELKELVQPHLRPDLEHLIETINRGPGVKTLGILRLDIGLNRSFVQEHLQGEGQGLNPLVRAAVRHAGASMRVPIVLAVASRRHGNFYESLAVGMRGVTRYSSALVVRPGEREGVFDIVGGLEARVDPEDIDHIVSRVLVTCGDSLLPRDFFNAYLQRYMLPERQEIVSKLCHYVFSGLNTTESLRSHCTVTPLHATIPLAAAG